MRQDGALIQYLQQVIAGEKPGLVARLVLLLLRLLEGVYWTLLQLNKIFARPRRLPVPVLSIGNLVAGGTGKTPTVIWLARQLQAAGYHPAVLTRGYGGQAQQDGVLFTHDDLARLQPEYTGDEPYLLAKLLPGLIVAVGRERYRMGMQALAAHPEIDCFILDDGLQYWKLHRDADIVLIDARHPFGNGHLIPRGILRESPSGLRRAQAVVLTRIQQLAPAELEQRIGKLKRINPIAPVGLAEQAVPEIIKLVEWDRVAFGQPANVYLAGRSVGVVTAIGNPQQFIDTLLEFGPILGGRWLFADHHHWSESAIDELLIAITASGLHEIVVTTKDAVKLNGFSDRFHQAGIEVLILTLDFTIKPATILEQILERIREKG